MSKKNNSRVTLYLEAGELQIIKKEAEHREMSFNSFAVKSLRKIVRERIPVLDQIPLEEKKNEINHLDIES